MSKDDLTFTETEAEFYKAFITILEHLKNRAVKAEKEVAQMRAELTMRREQVEFYGQQIDELKSSKSA